jgi:hypothetical protein
MSGDKCQGLGAFILIENEVAALLLKKKKEGMNRRRQATIR